MPTLLPLLLLLTAQPQPLPTPTQALVIAPTGQSGRIVITPDALAKQLITGGFSFPRDGDTLALPSGRERTWHTVEIDGGWIRSPDLRGGYAAISLPSESARTLILEARGHGMLYLNDEPRVGDPYSLGYVSLPIHLREGDNTLLFKGGRGDIHFSLREPKSEVEILTDHTFPDLAKGESGAKLAGILIANCTTEWASNLTINAGLSGLDRPTVSEVPPIPPLGLCKVPVEFSAAPAAEPTLHIEIVRDGEIIAASDHPLAVRSGTDVRRITFKSDIDGSVQYYALRPSTAPETNQSLILSLHGASVEATNQANAYTPKDWAAIVCPTNRRPFGFDWEDWGRLDALEVLDRATELLNPDPRRIYLTGHSMGGHGTWQIGAHYAPRFAAIAPSAGWISFWSYTGAGEYKDDNAVADALRRAASPSDTLALKSNLDDLGVYILHGDKDDNVPVEQARTMRQELARHPDLAYHEQPGAGHWWGNECVDWPPLMQFLRDRKGMLKEKVSHLRFATAAPSISSRAHWAEVLQQIEPFRTSTIDLVLDPERRILTGTTSNVRALALDLSHLGEGELSLTLDGHPLSHDLEESGTLHLLRVADAWTISEPPPPEQKSPARGGGFKDVFRNNVLLVVGTGGTPEENAAMLAKARYDSETFWYRGNATLPIVLDSDFHASDHPDRNIVLYGHADNNLAWNALLGGDAIVPTSGSIWINGEQVRTPGRAVLLIRPRGDSHTASVGVIAGTDLAGFRLAGRVPYFVSGVGIPDYLVIAPEAMDTGIDGIEAAGFFDNDWKLPDAAAAALQSTGPNPQ